MPYKRGPNGTLRLYSSANGRFCKSTLVIEPPKKQRKSQKRKEEERRTAIRNSAIHSKDKNLFEVYSLLEELRPGSVKRVNALIYDKSKGSEREIDLLTDKCVYEIKSGKAKHKTRQFLDQKRLAVDHCKDYVLFSPGSGKHQIHCLRQQGINAFRTMEDLLEYERKRKC